MNFENKIIACGAFPDGNVTGDGAVAPFIDRVTGNHRKAEAQKKQQHLNKDSGKKGTANE